MLKWLGFVIFFKTFILGQHKFPLIIFYLQRDFIFRFNVSSQDKGLQFSNSQFPVI